MNRIQNSMDVRKKRILFLSYLVALPSFLYVSSFDQNHLVSLIIWCVFSVYIQFCLVFGATMHLPQFAIKQGQRKYNDLRFVMFLIVTVVQVVLIVVMSNKSGLLS